MLQGYLPFELSGRTDSDSYKLHLDPGDFKHVSIEGKEFLRNCLQLNPQDRPKADQLMKHPWLSSSMHSNRQESQQGLSSPVKLADMVNPGESNSPANHEIRKELNFATVKAAGSSTVVSSYVEE